MGGPVIDEIFQNGYVSKCMGEERCLQLIMNDIWEDSDEQLDAWQRLYVRACVRKWFKYLIQSAGDRESGVSVSHTDHE